MSDLDATNPGAAGGVVDGAAQAGTASNGQGGGTDGADFVEHDAGQEVHKDQSEDAFEDEGGEGAENPEGSAGEGADAASAAKTGEVDLIDFELDGQVYKIPAALKDGYLRNADYTQKTQTLAQERQQLEARDAAQRQHIREYAGLIALNDQIQAYDNVDWDAFQASDPNAAQREWRNLTLLKEKRAGAVESFQAKEQQRALETQRARAKQIEDGHAQLAKDIPGWNTELGGKIVNFGANKYGFTGDELAGVTDPRLIRVLHDAMTGSQAKTVAEKVKTIEAVQAVKPAAQLRPGASTTPKDPSKMSIAQYHAWRNG